MEKSETRRMSPSSLFPDCTEEIDTLSINGQHCSEEKDTFPVPDQHFTEETETFPIPDQDCMEEIDALPIPDQDRKRFKELCQFILSLKGTAPISNADTIFDKIVSLIPAATNIITKISGVPVIFKLMAKAVALILSNDDVLKLMKQLEAYIEHDLIIKGQASREKMLQSLRYLEGFGDLSKLSTFEKTTILSLMASDCPVQTGLEEILFLGQKIKQMVKAVDMDKFSTLMTFVEFYCCLTIYRELFLLCRISVQSMLDTNAKPVQNVLRSQVSHDESVLEFLYKPTRRNVSLFYRFKQRHWSLVQTFLEFRGFNMEELGYMSKGVFKITSVHDGSCLRTPGYGLLLPSPKRVDCVFLDPHHTKTNVFGIQTAQSYINTSDKCLALSGRWKSWHFVKVHGESPSEKQCYVIWLESDVKRCMHYCGSFWATSLSTSEQLNNSFFWNIEPF